MGGGVDVGPKVKKILDFSSSTKIHAAACLVGDAVSDSGTVLRHGQQDAVID